MKKQLTPHTIEVPTEYSKYIKDYIKKKELKDFYGNELSIRKFISEMTCGFVEEVIRGKK